MMRNTPAYAELIEAGPQIIPYVVTGFKDYKSRRDKDSGILNRIRNFLLPRFISTEEFHREIWGMHWVLILMDLTHFTPIQPQSVAGGHMQAWSVNETCEAWIEWFDSQVNFK